MYLPKPAIYLVHLFPLYSAGFPVITPVFELEIEFFT